MKLGGELAYPMDIQFWKSISEIDPYEFPPLTALMELGEEGHDCWWFGWSHWEPASIQKFRGITFVHGTSNAERIKMADGFYFLDRMFTNDSDDPYWRTRLRDGGSWINYMHSDPTQGWVAERQYNRFDIQIAIQHYMASFFRTKYPGLRVEVVPMGANIGAIRPFAKPWSDRQFDLFLSGEDDRKGHSHMLELVPELNKLGITTFGPVPRVAKKEWYERISQFRYIYFPSIAEGLSRSLCEAVAVGVRPIVSRESTTSVMISDWIDPLVVTTGGYVAPVPDGLKFIATRPVTEIAKEIAGFIKSPQHEWRPNVDALDSRVTVDRLKQVILAG